MVYLYIGTIEMAMLEYIGTIDFKDMLVVLRAVC